jgi:uncharacterized Zn finger protein
MYFGWKRYVPAAKRRRKTARALAKLETSGQARTPVTAGRGAIAKTFWGKAWCQNLEGYSDYANRLPRGRTYLRSGSVIDLKIAPGKVAAQVMGSRLYQVDVNISEVPASQWSCIARDCAQSIDSLVELLHGQLSTSVMERITRPGTGLFPAPLEITFSCSCPDSAAMCKHVAATLYGVGVRLDSEPALLFSLRNVDATELITRVGESRPAGRKGPSAGRILDSSRLADVFGIDMANLGPKMSAAEAPAVTRKKAPAVTTKKAPALKKQKVAKPRRKSLPRPSR